MSSFLPWSDGGVYAVYVGSGSNGVQVNTRADAHAALRQSVCAGSVTPGTLLSSQSGVIRDSGHASIPWLGGGASTLPLRHDGTGGSSTQASECCSTSVHDICLIQGYAIRGTAVCGTRYAVCWYADLTAGWYAQYAGYPPGDTR
jgi:hypothetical protein